MDDKDTDGRSPWKALREGVGPVAVAAVVALGVAAAVDFVNGRDDEPKAKPAKKTALAAGRGDAPRRVVAVRRDGSALVVRDLQTGDDVGVTVAAPVGGKFHQIAPVEKGGYLVSAYGAGKVTFHRLDLDAQGRPRKLAELPRVTLPGASGAWSDLAVAADGRIAYVTYSAGRPRIDVLSPATGARQTWTTALKARAGGLSWAGDTLAYVWQRGQVRTIDTRGPAGDLKQSRPVLRLPAGATEALLARDGRTVVVAASGKTGLTLETYAADTGRRAGLLWQQRLDVPARLDRLTRDAAGTHLLAGAADGRLFADPTGRVRELTADDLADLAW